MIEIKERNANIDQWLVNELASKHNTTKEVISLLLNRGYDKDSLDLYIQKDSYYIESFNSITNVDKACHILSTYLEDDSAEIYVFADYDADGINAGYVLTDVLLSLREAIDSKANINIYYPNRSEGYGLSMNWCKKNFPRKTKKKKLVITVDNGITKKEEVDYLLSKNVECIITDHHHPKLDQLPNCLIVDPWLHDLNNINAKGLCGTAVAYKIAGRLLELYKDESNFILNYLPNVALATITDIMPSTPENIGFVKHGLWLLNNGIASESLLYYKNYINKEVNTTELGFEIGPQLNACGRMGKIQKAVEFMFETENLEDYYNELVILNDERKILEKEIVEKIFENDYSDDLIIVENIENLGGLGGTVASKVVEHYGKPCILLSGKDNTLGGSARTFNNIDILSLLKTQEENNNIIGFGGHKAAAGVELYKDKLQDFKKSLNENLKTLTILNEDNDNNEDNIYNVDKIVNLNNINKTTISPYKDLTYFGDLKEPIFALTNLEVLDAKSSNNNKDHLCLNLKDDTININKNRYGKLVGKEIWGWNKMPMYKRIGQPKNVHLIGKIIPDFRNPKFYTFDIIDILPA